MFLRCAALLASVFAAELYCWAVETGDERMVRRPVTRVVSTVREAALPVLLLLALAFVVLGVAGWAASATAEEKVAGRVEAGGHDGRLPAREVSPLV